MRIDVHAHYWTEDYLDLLVDLGQAGARDGFGPAVRAELGVQVAQVGLDGVPRRYSSLAISGTVRLVGR